MTPSLVKKMTTIFQVTFAEPPLAINYPRHWYIFKRTSTCIESLPEICSRWVVEVSRAGAQHRTNYNRRQIRQKNSNYIFVRWYLIK
jgi:hypothetical protein